jgi:hypothetical protein
MKNTGLAYKSEKRSKYAADFPVDFLFFYPSACKRPEHFISGFADIRQVFPEIGTKRFEELVIFVASKSFNKGNGIRAELQDKLNVR